MGDRLPAPNGLGKTFPPANFGRPVYISGRGLKYLFGAPGVGRPLAICAPPACAWVNAAVTGDAGSRRSVHGRVRKSERAARPVIVEPAPPLPPPLPPPVVDATTAVSWFAPLSIVIGLAGGKA
jgi:hypothetical protein